MTCSCSKTLATITRNTSCQSNTALPYIRSDLVDFDFFSGCLSSNHFKKIKTKMVEKKKEKLFYIIEDTEKKKLKFKIKLMGSAHRITGPDRSFVTVGRSLTVANGFSPLKNGCFITPFGVGFGDPLLPA